MKNIDEKILKWAQARGTAFTSAEAYEAVDFVQDIKEMSDRIRKLFITGYLARKKMDSVRYSYIAMEFAPPDFDKCTARQPEIQEETKALAAPAIEKEAHEYMPAPSARISKKSRHGKDISISVNPAPEKLPESYCITLAIPGGITISITTGI